MLGGVIDVSDPVLDISKLDQTVIVFLLQTLLFPLIFLYLDL